MIMKKKWIFWGVVALIVIAAFIWVPRVALVAIAAGIIGWIGRGLYNKHIVNQIE